MSLLKYSSTISFTLSKPSLIGDSTSDQQFSLPVSFFPQKISLVWGSLSAYDSLAASLTILKLSFVCYTFFPLVNAFAMRFSSQEFTLVVITIRKPLFSFTFF